MKRWIPAILYSRELWIFLVGMWVGAFIAALILAAFVYTY